MEDLRLVGVQDDGAHLLLAGPEGQRFRLPLDDALRAAARRDRPRLGQLQIELDGGLRPRDVQAMIRSGATAEEAADRAGWTVEKVHRYEGPILAERAFIADQAQLVRLRRRGGGSGAPTLAERVLDRMHERGADAYGNIWDAWRTPEGTWTVVLRFAAGGREREASWSFDPVLGSVDALDDEARWLSEEEPEAASAAAATAAAARAAVVYDVEAEGGVVDPGAGSPRDRSGSGSANSARSDSDASTAAMDGSHGSHATDDPVDLMTAMRERSTVRGRRPGGRRRATPSEKPAAPAGRPAGDAPAKAHPAKTATPDEALPLEDLEPAPTSPPVDSVDTEDTVDSHVTGPTATAPAPTEAREADGTAVDAERVDAAESAESPEPVESAGPVEDEPSTPPGPGEQPQQTPAKRPAARKNARPSVPSWDDIMFGSRRD